MLLDRCIDGSLEVRFDVEAPLPSASADLRECSLHGRCDFSGGSPNRGIHDSGAGEEPTPINGVAPSPGRRSCWALEGWALQKLLAVALDLYYVLGGEAVRPQGSPCFVVSSPMIKP